MNTRWMPFVLTLSGFLIAGCQPTGRTQASKTTSNTSKQTTTQSTEQSAIQPLRVAAAADLLTAFPEIEAAFARRHPDIDVVINYGSSEQLVEHIEKYGETDIFFAANRGYPQQLIEKNLADRAAQVVYAHGRLVVWVPKGSPLDLKKQGVRVLADASVRKIAIANPAKAPYGAAAVAALKKLGIYNKVRSRLIQTENVAQAAFRVEEGKADAGVIAMSLALSPLLKGKGRYVEIPRTAFPPLAQGAVILKKSSKQKEAALFLAFVMGPEGRKILHEFGFVASR